MQWNFFFSIKQFFKKITKNISCWLFSWNFCKNFQNSHSTPWNGCFCVYDFPKFISIFTHKYCLIGILIWKNWILIWNGSCVWWTCRVRHFLLSYHCIISKVILKEPLSFLIRNSLFFFNKIWFAQGYTGLVLENKGMNAEEKRGKIMTYYRQFFQI